MLQLFKGLTRTTKFDPECSDLADRHYSRQKRGELQFIPPGQTLVLRDANAEVLFVWCCQKFRLDNQTGVNCTLFRNESWRLSSDIILEAERFVFGKWGRTRLFTFIDPAKVRSINPGCCFIKAGWNRCGRTKSGKLIFEKFA